MTTTSKTPDLYKEAGVDVEKGDRLVDWLKSDDKAPAPSRHGAVVSGIGGFAALFRPDFRGLEDPLLISSTDGVGTKVLLGIETGHLEGLGQDLVAMCVNDLYTIGGRPLFFLDYYATGVLDEEQFKAVLRGIKKSLDSCGCALMGGETAELPGLYEKGHFDLAGFVVGIVDGKKVLGAERVREGDALYAIAASGFHSNGYSLVRRWLQDRPTDPRTLEKLMTPTRIYHEIPALVERLGVENFHALANITGGGISGNLPRVMPNGVVCEIDLSKVPIPKWMGAFIEAHGVSLLSQEAVFNLGAGMIAAIAPAKAGDFEREAGNLGLPVAKIGAVKGGGSGEATVAFV